MMKTLAFGGNGWLPACCVGGALALALVDSQAADRPQWGEAWTRNMVSAETGLPDSFDIATGRNVKWSVALGKETHGTPVIARGRVLIGTNNGAPRDAKHQGDRGVLMCFRERDGQFLWQWVAPKREGGDRFLDWPNSGMCSPPTVEGDTVYMLNNRGEVGALDLEGMTNGNDGPYRDESQHMTPRENAPPQPLEPGPTDADIRWLFDLVSGAGIYSHDAAHASILIDGPYLYLNSCNGVDNTHRKIRAPEAPSLVVLDKRTGRYVARDDEHIGPRIFHCTWSSPALMAVEGRRQVIFCGGDGVIYAFEPLDPAMPMPSTPTTLKRIWRFDPDPTGPKENVHKYNGNRKESPSNIKSVPICSSNRVYVTVGGDLWWGKEEVALKCIDATKTGDITQTGLVWSYPLRKHTMSSPAVGNGLVFVGDSGRRIHCVDAATGQPYWTQETQDEIWASPLMADGKVYFCDRGGTVWVFAPTKEKKVLAQIDLGSPISATPVAANGVLYLATMNRLYALQLVR